MSKLRLWIKKNIWTKQAWSVKMLNIFVIKKSYSLKLPMFRAEK